MQFLAEIDQRVLRSLGRLHREGFEQNPLLLIDWGVFKFDLCRHQDPVPLTQGTGLGVLAQEAEKPDIVHTAGHGVPAWNKAPAGQLGAGHGLGLERDGFPGVALRMLLRVQIPDAVVVVLQGDVRLVQGVGQNVLHLQLLAFFVLKDDFRHPVRRPDGPFPAGQGHIRGAAVEQDQIRLGHRVDNHGLHIGPVHLKCGAVDDVDGLVKAPAAGQVELAQKVDGPHAVVLHQNPFGLIAAVDLVQKRGGELLRGVYGNHSGV